MTIDRRRLLGYAVGAPLFFALFLFLPAGDFLWVKGWEFVAGMSAAGVICGLVLWRVNPEVIAARVNATQGTKPWDRVLLVFFFTAALATIPVAALDAGRFRWMPVPWWVCGAGNLLLMLGTALVTWAQAVNRFFEVTVRLQEERGHRVIDAGPYAFVRHPGYLAWVAMAVGIALGLGSLWALIPAGLSVAVLVVRTRWEDDMLQEELPGYREYAARVRYRLVPGVW
ncbi:MAG: methyltransferase family protein [Gemmataceae bacterium]